MLALWQSTDWCLMRTRCHCSALWPFAGICPRPYGLVHHRNHCRRDGRSNSEDRHAPHPLPRGELLLGLPLALLRPLLLPLLLQLRKRVLGLPAVDAALTLRDRARVRHALQKPEARLDSLLGVVLVVLVGLGAGTDLLQLLVRAEGQIGHVEQDAKVALKLNTVGHAPCRAVPHGDGVACASEREND